MNKFINFDINKGLSINTYAATGASYGTICELANAVTHGDENISCSLDGAIEALEDGFLWQGSGVTQEALEEIHNFISLHEETA